MRAPDNESLVGSVTRVGAHKAWNQPSCMVARGDEPSCQFLCVSHKVYDVDECYVAVRLDLGLIEQLRLEITVQTVRHSILTAPKIKLSENDVEIISSFELRVLPPNATKDCNALFELHRCEPIWGTPLADKAWAQAMS